ncbi:MAG: caspase family protein, partial [Hyphomicrobiales bacterium]|nr:caspase family protein [Hyphomicrobiales bacterium]
AYAAGATVDITVTAQDEGGGIGAVTLFQNGKKLPPEAVFRSEDQRRNNAAVRVVTFRVTLVAGANHFEASGASEAEIEGVPAALDIAAPGAPRLPDLHVVTVGINKYRNKDLDLDYGAPDALAVLQQLSKATSSVFGRVIAYKILDEAASRTGILSVLDGLRQTRPDDVVALYLAGHGEIIGKEWYFLPGDASIASADALARTSISGTEFRDTLSRVGAQRILVLIDACKSGGSIDAFSGAMDRKALREVGREAGVAILAATRKDQLAAELPTLGHGAFTYILLQGLAGKADLDPPDGKVTAAKLLTWSTTALPSFTQRSYNYLQVPVAYARGTDFLLSRAGAP